MSKDFSSRKQNNDQISSFLEVSPAEHSVWLFSIANVKACIIYLTAIVKMRSISCLSLIHKHAWKIVWPSA